MLKQYLINQIKQVIKQEYHLLSREVILTNPPDAQLGDWSFACFSLAKKIKQSPDKVAQHLSEQLQIDKIITKIVVVGPYINFFVNKTVWFKYTLRLIQQKGKDYGRNQQGLGKRVMVEFSSPNTNKPQHLGHLRNDLIGDALSNLLTFSGYQVIRSNLINDRGIHIAKAMLAYQKWGENKTPTSEKMKGDYFVGDYYRLFGKKVKENPHLLDEAQDLLKKWERRDNQTIALWQKLNDWALNGLIATYQELGIKFDRWYFESEIYQSGKKIILQALKKGLCYQQADGAIEIDLGDEKLGKKVLLRADHTSIYITQDIGLAKLKFDQYNLDKSIYVVGSEQIYYLQVLFKILKLLSFPWAEQCYHLTYGMVNLPSGKMKSREGNVVEIDTLIQELKQLAQAEILSREPNISGEELNKRSKKIALGALKFYVLKFTLSQEVNFKPKESISFEGNTGPYLQYTYARIQGILNKAKTDEPLDLVDDFSALKEETEIQLLKLLSQFPEVVKQAGEEYNPAQLANYLLCLTQSFNKFYHQCSVLQASTKQIRQARLVLISSVAIVLENGLHLLGIKPLDQM
ncbi:MAG: arginine--tRNA ligase [Candidatus Aenigmarchaeota archaeon]|nr:arginine--tRNA ligase [Candidatus Aenigmarchaeota archaeon]